MTSLFLEIIRVQSANISEEIIEVAEQKQITTICMGKPHINLLRVILATNIFDKSPEKVAVFGN
jgi:two-component system sensor histidine kinase KdpD